MNGNMEDLLSSAKKGGMYLVNDSDTEELEKEYDEGIITCDKLCEILDPESTPYLSKYEARKILDNLCNKLEATKTIASLEKRRGTMTLMDKKLASARVRLGTISWECDEPHNAQIDLELAATYYFSGFVESVISSLGDHEKKESDEALNDMEIKELLAEKIVSPVIDIDINDEIVDAMKCLNMLGILWFGRTQVRKALLYLLAVKGLYHKADKASYLITVEASFRRDLDYIYTHNLFYLAQAYGNLGDLKESSEYCRETLQRQLTAGLDCDIKGAFDWAKNCAGIADFFQSMGQYRHCATALASAEKILNEKVIKKIDGENQDVSVVEGSELAADIHRRWAILDGKILKGAFDVEMAKRNTIAVGETWEDPFIDEEEEIIRTCSSSDDTPPPLEQHTADNGICLPPKPPVGSGGVSVELFLGCPVYDTSLLKIGDIQSFEAARVVFLRAVGRIEAAKKVFILDGFVTDHVTLVQEHSKLYHYLALFEMDPKRRLAMECRRLNLLQPLLSSLNRVSFEGLHKQVSYELGETYLTLLEIKTDKIRDRSGAIDKNKLKKSEILKCNLYCKGILAMFSHFSNMYSKQDGRSDAGYEVTLFENCTIEQLMAAGCVDPDESLFSEDEVRPFLNAHFMCCRALSKVIVDPSSIVTQTSGADYLVASLHRYTWLFKYANNLCKKKSIDINTIFGEEIQICSDMINLLPSKIDRMHFLGEGGLDF